MYFQQKRDHDDDIPALKSMTILDYGSSSSGEVVFGYYFAVVFFSHRNRNNNVCMCLFAASSSIWDQNHRYFTSTES